MYNLWSQISNSNDFVNQIHGEKQQSAEYYNFCLYAVMFLLSIPVNLDFMMYLYYMLPIIGQLFTIRHSVSLWVFFLILMFSPTLA